MNSLLNCRTNSEYIFLAVDPFALLLLNAVYILRFSQIICYYPLTISIKMLLGFINPFVCDLLILHHFLSCIPEFLVRCANCTDEAASIGRE